jgi:hypothetical protein
MKKRESVRSAIRWSAAGVGLAAASYAGYVAFTWYRYGQVKPSANPLGRDSLLDGFIPRYDVVDRYAVRVAAPAEIVFSAACDLKLQESAMISAIFKSRALILRSKPDERARALGLAEQAKSWGWGVLAEIPGREIIFGGVTQPWLANPSFKALSPDEFQAFHEPGYVKIAWTLRADPLDAEKSVARTETRVATTDPLARVKFRRYWAFLSPGIILIRRVALRLVKTEAERRVREASFSEESLRYDL